MGKVVFSITVSMDGFVAGPNDSPENGLCDGGNRLIGWYFGGDLGNPHDGKFHNEVRREHTMMMM